MSRISINRWKIDSSYFEEFLKNFSKWLFFRILIFLANLAIFKNFFRIFKGPLRHTLLLRKLKRCQKWLKNVEISRLAFLKKFKKNFQNESFCKVEIFTLILTLCEKQKKSITKKVKTNSKFWRNFRVQTLCLPIKRSIWISKYMAQSLGKPQFTVCNWDFGYALPLGLRCAPKS